MTQPTSNPQAEHRAELLTILGSLIELLESVDEQHWLSWARNCRARIDDWDEFGIDSLLEVYGGMGSFNDLVLHPANGHGVPLENLAVLNDRLDRLRSDAYAIARRLRALL